MGVNGAIVNFHSHTYSFPSTCPFPSSAPVIRDSKARLLNKKLKVRDSSSSSVLTEWVVAFISFLIHTLSPVRGSKQLKRGSAKKEGGKEGGRIMTLDSLPSRFNLQLMVSFSD